MYVKKLIEKRLEVLRGNERHLINYMEQLQSDVQRCDVDLTNCRDEIKELEDVLAEKSEEKQGL